MSSRGEGWRDRRGVYWSEHGKKGYEKTEKKSSKQNWQYIMYNFLNKTTTN